MSNDERLDLLAQVAVLYFEDGFNQDQIAKMLGKSRSMVSRMLNSSREMGLIEVHVKYALKRNYILEREIKEKYGLKDVYLLNTKNMISNDLKENMLGRLSAQCISTYLKPGIKIGIGWSRTLYKAFSMMPESPVSDSVVIQMSGSVSLKDLKFDGIDLARMLSNKIGGQYFYCPAPLVVSSEDMKDSLLKENMIRDVLDKAGKVDLAVLGIGNIKNKKSSLMESGLVSKDSLLEIENDISGDLLGRQFDENGKLLDISLNRRVIAVAPDAIKKIPTVIAVASGVNKAGAILSAIKGNWFNTLISDDETMKEMLRLERA